MRTRIALVLLLGAWSAFPVGAEDEPPPEKRSTAAPKSFRISIQDAVDLALARNLGLKSARIQALLARLTVEERDAEWDPTVTASVEGGEQKFPSRSTLAGANVVDNDNLNFALGVQKRLRSGLIVNLDWTLDREFTNSTFSTINPSYDSNLSLALTIPLLRGLGRKVNEASLREARLAAQQSFHAFELEIEKLIEEVVAAYWELAYQQDRLEVLTGSLELARELERAEVKRKKAGAGTELEVVKARSVTKRREADRIQGAQDLAAASDALRKLILPFTGGKQDMAVLLATDEPGSSYAPPALDSLVDRALSQRRELLQADLEVKRLRELLTIAEDALKPKLDLTGRVSSRGTRGTAGRALGDSLGNDAISASATLAFEYTFGMRAAKADVRRKRLELEAAVLNRLEQINTIVAEVRDGHRTVLAQVQSILATDEEIVAATEALRGERSRLARGESTLLQVQQIEDDLFQARLRGLRSRLDLETARVRLGLALGGLLRAFEIELDDGLRSKQERDAGAAANRAEGDAKAQR